MNSQGRQTGSFGDELTNAAMIGLVGLFGIALVLRAPGPSRHSSPARASPPVVLRPGSVCCSIRAIPLAPWTRPA